MTGIKLLVVEDDFLIRLTLSETLQDEGFTVLEAGDTDEAFALIEGDDQIRLLITDIQLPGSMNGRAMAKKARALRPELPVIYMSGRLDPNETLDPVLEAVIGKPYLPSEVCATARRLIAA